LAIPFAAVGAAVMDFAIALVMLLVLMIAYGVMPGPQMFLAPLLFLIILLGAAGIGTLLSALTVAYRDFRYVVTFLMQVWMFATPSVYMKLDPEKNGLLHSLLYFNPMTSLIAGFRSACLGGEMQWVQLGLSTGVVLGIFLIGCFYFRRVEDNFADII
jgi:lipopolysaccharide transport system permease protein